MSQKQDDVPKPKAKRRRMKSDTPPTKSNMTGNQTNSGLTDVGGSPAQSTSSFAPSSSSFVPPMLIPKSRKENPQKLILILRHPCLHVHPHHSKIDE